MLDPELSIAALRAQIEAAEWAKLALFAAFAQTLISVVGIGFVVATLKQNAKSTAAALRAVSVSESALASDRAWIMYGKGTNFYNFSSFSKDGVEMGPYYAISIALENAGRSPATNVNLWVTHQIAGADDPVPTFVSEIGNDATGIIGPSQVFHTNRFFLSPAEVQMIQSGEASLYAYSNAKYRDIFAASAVRETEFAAKIDIHRQVDPATRELQLVTTMTPLGPQNRAT